MLSLEETIKICLDTQEFMPQYRRLTGANLGYGNPIHKMIDRATGYDEVEAKKLFDFIRDYIWIPSQASAINEKIYRQNQLTGIKPKNL